jgi:hypothetical protein
MRENTSADMYGTVSTVYDTHGFYIYSNIAAYSFLVSFLIYGKSLKESNLVSMCRLFSVYLLKEKYDVIKLFFLKKVQK